MTLLARILSHGFAIAIVVLLAIGLIYRGKLFPGYELPDFLRIGEPAGTHEEARQGAAEPATTTPQGSEQIEIEVESGSAPAVSGLAVEGPAAAEEAVEPEPVPPPEEVTAPQPPAGIEAAPGNAGPEASGAAPEAEGGRESQLTPPAAPPAAEVGEAATSLQEPSAAAAADTGGPAAAAPEAATPPPEQKYGAAPQDTDTAVPGATSLAKPYQLLADAREAYWLRDYATAESKYLELIRLEPENPDGYGELGNMYFSQGEWEHAATAYYEAGSRLVNQGLLSQAEEMVAVIRGLNGAGTQAKELEKQIAAARAAGD